MSSKTISKIAVILKGKKFSDDTVYTFRYSNTGFTGMVGDDTQPYYYEPFINDSILIESELDKKSSGISINLVNDGTLNDNPLNDDGSLTNLLDYTFEGHELSIYISREEAPSSSKFYLIYTSKIKKLHITRRKVVIESVSPFEVFDKDINPETFSGIPTSYEGGAEMKGKVKPRLIGKVFNIEPELIYPVKLIYGCNWGEDGNFSPVTSFDAVKDGGLPLTLDTDATGSSSGDYATTALMDAFTPPAGEYVTCVAHGTIKIGSIVSPKGITIDVTQDTNTYIKWIQLLTSELSFNGYFDHGIQNYTIGSYASSSKTYISMDEELKNNLDIALWFGVSGHANVSLVRDNGVDNPVVKFVEAGITLSSDTDIVATKITRDSYDLPYKRIQMNYKKNYTVQDDGTLATSLTEAQKLPFREEYSYEVLTNVCTPDPYVLDNSIEYETAIFGDSTDASDEISAWLDKRKYITDYLTVTCPILSYNADVILGAIIEKDSTFLNMSVTDTYMSFDTVMMNNNNPFYSDQDMLRLGDIVEVASLDFDYTNHRFVVYGSKINTRTMFVEYKLFGVRKSSECT